MSVCGSAMLLKAVGTLVVVSSLTIACGRNREEVADAPGPDPYAPTPLTVDNHNWLDVVVFIYHDGELSRVGTVTAASTANFFLPSWMLGQERVVSLLGDPVGSSDAARTDPLKIQPGQMIEWRLESHLARSSVMVH